MSFLNKQSAVALLLALLGMIVLLGHQTVPPMDRDESRFAQASKQMVTSGDVVTIRFQDELRAKKPAGIYWLQSASAALFGTDSIAAYRVPSLLAYLLSIAGTYHLARQIYKPPRAFLSAATLGVSLLMLAEAHLAKTDAALMLACLVQQFALMTIYRAWQQGRRPPHKADLWFWCALAAGIMIKGPIAPLLAILTLASLAAWHRSAVWLRNLRPLRGFIILGALTLPWAILVTLATDGAFLKIAINADFLSKVSSAQESHGAPIGTYLMLVALLLWPGILLLPRAVAQLPTFLAHVETRFLLAWIVPFWIIIELMPTKLPHYPLPVFPALAVLLLSAVDAKLPGVAKGRMKERLAYWVAFIMEYALIAVGFLLAGVLFWAALQYGGVTGGRAFAFAVLSALAVAAAIWYGIIWHREGGVRPVLLMLTAGLCVNAILIVGLLPALSRIHVSTAIADQITAEKMAPGAIAAAGYHEPSLVFLLGTDLLLVNGSEAALFLAEAPGGLAIVEQRQQAVFLETVKTLNLRLAPPVQLAGINVSKGQDVIIWLYRVDKFDAISPSG